jgi:hypothetical protein
MAKFYVYEHWRPDTGKCFYVGKGRGNRAYAMNKRNKYHVAIRAKLEGMGLSVEIRIIHDGLSEEDAWQLEIAQIAMWKANGIKLANMSSGGEGPAGRPALRGEKHPFWGKPAFNRGKKASDETRALLSIAAKKREKVFGRKHTEEAKAKISAAKKGIPSPKKGIKLSDEERAKISAAVRLANEGKPNTFLGKKHSEESKRRMSETRSKRRGWRHKEETRKKISEAQRGRSRPLHTEETRAKISESLRVMHKRKRESHAAQRS